MSPSAGEEAANDSHSLGGTVLAWLQLLRLPNVFTAIADVLMGYLVVFQTLEPGIPISLLVGSSVCLYLAGMVLNDVFDQEGDAEQRPDRPIPSRRIPSESASKVGWSLLALGVIVAAGASGYASDPRPVAIAALLAASIVIYDGPTKATWLGPILMGLCRMLNVLLGMSLAVVTGTNGLLGLSAEHWLISGGIAVYIVGLTWFARRESNPDSRRHLLGGMLVLLAGIAIIGSIPVWPEVTSRLKVSVFGWYLFWLVMALLIGRRFTLAVLQPSPRTVKLAVKGGILSIIVIDAGVCLGFCGPYWGCLMLLLMAPAVGLGKWIYST